MTTEPKDYPEGIHLNISMEDYRSAPGINVSSLKEVGTSPRHYLSAISEGPSEPTDAQRIGTVTHSAVLENRFDLHVVRPAGMKFTTAEGKAWKAAQTLPIIDSEDDIRGMVTACHNHPMARSLLFGEGNNEVSCWRKHAATGLMTKARADRLTQDGKGFTTVVDLKTTDRGGASLEEFSKSIFKWGYALQAAHYLASFEATFFCFVCVEKLPPYAVACYHLSPEAIAFGRRKCDGYLATIKQCIDSGEWPCYPETLTTISLPEWVLNKEVI